MRPCTSPSGEGGELLFHHSLLETVIEVLRIKRAMNYQGDAVRKARRAKKVGHSERYNLCQNRYFFFVSRKRGDLTRVNSTNLFTGHGADIVVQAQHLDPGDVLDHRLHDRPGPSR